MILHIRNAKTVKRDRIARFILRLLHSKRFLTESLKPVQKVYFKFTWVLLYNMT